MGVSYCYLLENGLGFAIASSIFLGEDQDNMALCSVNFRRQSSESKFKVPFNSDSSVEVVLSTNMATMTEMTRLTIKDSSFSPKHEAALKLQKVYKSFRTRRKLADCAVLIEQSCWRLLDFVELKHSSISFFDIDKQETAISRWSRARTRAAKVGKGLSKNGKAQKLAIQHWLEAIDPRHRYGHNLHFYYVKWLHSQSKEPFFYWLDIGEGKEINMVEKCTRSKLQQQCIKYLGPMERKAYEVAFKNGILCYKETNELIDTTGEPKAKCIFVLSTSRILYIGKKKKGTFQHSSFLAGGAALAAGRIVVENGILKAAWPHSGHYRPTPENFQDFVLFLNENNIELNNVKLDVFDEEDDESLRRTSFEAEEIVKTPTMGTNLTLEIPRNEDFIENSSPKNLVVEPDNDSIPPESPTDLIASEEGEIELERINSPKGSKNYQLCGKWSSGAGPRIGILRDYPSELQSHALEQANLSPRSSSSPRFNLFSHTLTATSNGVITVESRRSPLVMECKMRV